MSAADPNLNFNTKFDPQTGLGVNVAPGLVRISAPNSSPYTFTGTNSFLIGDDELGLVDPGPLSDAHETALMRAIGGRPVKAILLTHTHKDHSAAAAKWRDQLGVPLWFGGAHRLSRPRHWLERNPIQNSCDWELQPDRELSDGDVLLIDQQPIEVLATPGHCANHLAFGLMGTPTLLTGDHIMGWNSTLISVPDGSMADYFASLSKILATPYQLYVPAHGDVIANGPAYARALSAHRHQRNGQILTAIGEGAHSVAAITRAIYPKLGLPIILAAQMTVKAHIEYLAARGDVQTRRWPWGLRINLPR